jgi:arylsulfatase A-like enzyme
MARAGRLVCTLAVLVFGSVADPGTATAQNAVVVVLDDVGVDLLGSYAAFNAPTPPPEHAATPNLDALAQEGILFRNVWVTPLCSSTRAVLMTGQYGYRTGVGAAGTPLPPGVPTLPQALQPAGYASAALGKWHLTNYKPENPDPGYTPIEAGFDAFRGTRANIQVPGTYFLWPKVVEIPPDPPAVTSGYTVYATSDLVDDALAFLAAPPPGPWLLWIAFHAVHTPLGAPPADLHTQDDDPDWVYEPGDPPMPGDERRVHRAMLEAMDTEIGRLAAALDPSDTTVFVVGDNGTAFPLPEAIDRGGKSDIWEGGIHVPLLVVGQAVAAAARGQETEALTHGVDVFATILDLAGVVADPETPIDGVSFLPVLADPTASPRAHVYTDGVFRSSAERDVRSHDVAVRDARYKLIRRTCVAGGVNPRELYDLENDPGEQTDLAASSDPVHQQALAELEVALAAEMGPEDGACTPPPRKKSCGLGFEVALPLWLLARRRRSA